MKDYKNISSSGSSANISKQKPKTNNKKNSLLSRIALFLCIFAFLSSQKAAAGYWEDLHKHTPGWVYVSTESYQKDGMLHIYIPLAYSLKGGSMNYYIKGREIYVNDKLILSNFNRNIDGFNFDPNIKQDNEGYYIETIFTANDNSFKGFFKSGKGDKEKIKFDKIGNYRVKAYLTDNLPDGTKINGQVAMAKFEVAMPWNLLSQKNTVKIRLFEQKEIPEYTFEIDKTNINDIYNIVKLTHQPSKKTPGKMEVEVTVSPELRKAHVPYTLKWFDDSIYVDENNRQDMFTLDNGDRSDWPSVERVIGEAHLNDFVTFSFYKDINSRVYVWPEEIRLTYDDKGYVIGSFELTSNKNHNKEDYIIGDNFEIQRSSSDDFSMGTTEVIATIPYEWENTGPYEFKDDVRNFGKDVHFYYRLRRTNTQNYWKWDYTINNSIEVTQKLITITPVSIEMTDSVIEKVIIDGVEKDSVRVLENEAAKLTWTLSDGVWPEGTELVIYRRNLTKGSEKAELVRLNFKDAQKNAFYDETLMPYNRMEYSLCMVLPKGTGFNDPPMLKMPGTAVTTDLGVMSDLLISKGYFSDRVELQWEPHGRFDGYRIRRAEYGKEAKDTILLATLPAAGNNIVLTEDRKGVAGVYYTYFVDGYVHFEDKDIYSNVLSGVGFRSHTGNIYGRITYKSGQAVKNADVLVEGEYEFEGRSIYFNGSDNYLKVDRDIKAGDEFTIQAYIYPDKDQNTSSVIISKQGEYEISLDAGRLKFTCGSDVVITDSILKTDGFSHITAMRTKSALVLYVNGVEIAHADVKSETNAHTENVTFIGRNHEGGYYKGYVDEVRVWKTALDKDVIMRDYTRLLYGGEKNLIAYWRFDDGIENEFYDISYSGNNYNTNHGTIHGATYNKTTPKDYQLCLKGITNENGNYEINGIPYVGNGTTYRIIPKLGTHQFDPTEHQRLLSENKTSHNCDFTDISAFAVSGYVYYDKTNVPVKDAMFKVDGINVLEKNGEMSKTDENGKFTISVPVGIHDVRVYKPNHTFVNNGRITDSNGKDLNYNSALSSITLYDSTLVKVVGRVAGGALQDSYVVGHSVSKNNLSEKIQVKIKIPNDKYKLNLKESDVIVKEPAFRPSKEKNNSSWNDEHYTELNYKANSNIVEITPDLKTGEFVAWLIPEDFVVDNATAAGYGSLIDNKMSLDLRNVFVEMPSINNYKSEEIVNKDTVTVSYSDTVYYNSICKIIKRNSPSIELKQLKNGKECKYIGDEYSSANTMNGKNMPVKVFDEATGKYLFNDHPFFTSDVKYVYEVAAFEEYPFYNEKGESIKEKYERVPVSDGIASFYNNISIENKTDTVHLDEEGKARYSFVAGKPDITSSGLKKFELMLGFSSENIEWKGNPVNAYVTGSAPKGSRFVTRGPDKLKFILRDPPGSNSYSYIEEGLSIESSSSYIGNVVQEGDDSWETMAGSSIVTWYGEGMGTEISTDIKDKKGIGIIHTESLEGVLGTYEKMDFSTSFKTSDSPFFVGADGDLYVGNSTNLIYGDATCVYLLPKHLYMEDKHKKLAESGDYYLVRASGLALGLEFSTLFAYPQSHIENVLIPELKRLRNSFILPNTMSEDEAKSVAESKGMQMYLSKLDVNDKNFGKNNFDPVFKNYPGYDENKFSEGPSYKTILPSKFKETQNDTIIAFNTQISNWENLISRNEKEKAEAEVHKNYSFHSGSTVEYSETYSAHHEHKETFNIGIGANFLSEWGTQINGTGVLVKVSEKAITNHGGSFSNSSGNSCKTGFVFSDGGTNEYHTVDVCKVKLSNDEESKDSIPESTQKTPGFVFKLRGGATSCPFEAGYKTKYYNKGTVIDQRTAQIEVPVIKAETSIANNIPSSRKAVYKIKLINASEIDSDCIYDLNVNQKSNPYGAKFFIDGAPIGNGLSFLIPGDGEITKTLEVGIGTELEYKDLQLVLHSQCDIIGDTLNITANFVPSCSDIHLSKPLDKWVLNSNSEKDPDGNYILHIRADEFDINYKNFRCIKLQYKPSSASDAEWVDIMHYYPTDSLYNSSGFAENEKAMIPEGGIIDYEFNMQSLPDQNYDICAVAVCANGIETISNIATGVKDTKLPELFGSVQPANGILGIEDEVRLNFNEPIAEGLLSQMNFEVSGIRNGEVVSRSASVRFDGNNDYLATETERNLSNKDFTVETGLFIDKLEHESTIFSHGNINNSFEISLTPEKKLKIKIGNDEYSSEDAIDMKAGEWEHIAVVYDDGPNPHLKAFYNKDEIIDSEVAPYTGIGNIEIGRSITSGNYFCGKLSELRIWDKALSLGTIVKNMNVSLKGTEIGLMSYYPMNECSGRMVLDKSHGSNAVMKSAQWFINRQGYAAEFKGDSYLKLSTSALAITNDMDYTIEFWFKGQSGQKDVALFSNGRGDNDEYDGSAKTMYIGFDENGKLVVRSNGYTSTIEDDDYLDNAWHHFALTVNRNIGRANIFVDNVLKSYFDAAALHSIESDYAYLGARRWYTNKQDTEPVIDQYYKGSIDEFRIWNLYKNEAIIMAEDNINLKGSEMGLFTYYPFERYKSWQGNMEMEFTTADMTIRDANAPVIEDAEIVNVDKTMDSAPIKERGPIAPVQIRYVVNNDALIINPDVDNGWDDYEQSIVTFKVKDIKDEHRNAIKNPIAWSAFIDRNHLRWSEDKLEISMDVYEETTFTVDVMNLGGYVQNYTIENHPSWLYISPDKGSIDPKSQKQIRFVIDEGLNIGRYNEIIYLVNENGVARALELNIKVNGEKPDWNVNPEDYKYNMSVYGKLRINNIFSSDKEDIIAAFMDGKCIGVTNNKYFKNEDMWYTFLTIYGNEIQQDGIVFRIWDDSSGKIYSAKGNIGDMPFVNNKIYGTPDEPVIFDGEELIYQNIALKSGWNWISFNLENELLNNVDETLGDGIWSNDDEVKNDKYTDSYSEKEGRWIGSLSQNGGFDNFSMYMLKSAEEQTISVEGKKINVYKNPVTIVPGWNYIGYPLPVNMSVTEALSDYKAEKGDIIKSQTAFAMYSEKNTWVGNLTYMEANKGYMLYRNADADSVTFKYPTNTGSLTKFRSNKPSMLCSDAIQRFPHNMSVIAIPGGDFQIQDGDNINAYINGELRGMAQRVATGNDEHLWFFNIPGDSESSISFVAERNGENIAVSSPVMRYHSDDVQGSLQKPVVLEFVNIDDEVNVYPRIFDSYVNLSVMHKDTRSVNVCIYNLEGKMEKQLTINADDDVVFRKLDLSSLVLGHHIITVAVNNGSPHVFKIEKKQ